MLWKATATAEKEMQNMKHVWKRYLIVTAMTVVLGLSAGCGSAAEVKFLQVFIMTNPFLTVLLPSLSRDSHSDVPPLFQMSDNPWLHCYLLYQKWHAEQQTEHGLSRPPER